MTFRNVLATVLVAALLLTAIPAYAAEADTPYTDGGFTYTVQDSKATITDYVGAITSTMTIPATLGGFPVTAIGNSAFDRCDFSRVVVPDGVTGIGNYAFNDCNRCDWVRIGIQRHSRHRRCALCASQSRRVVRSSHNARSDVGRFRR